jgi:hypothetical protein
MSEHLKHKMYEHEVAPPGKVWNAIENELDGNASFSALADKVYSYEAAPPANAWGNILATLEQEAPAPQVPVRSIAPKRFPGWMAAAAIVILLFTGSYFFFNAGNRENNARALASSNTTTNTDEQKNTSSLAPGSNKPAVDKLKATVHSYYTSYSRKKTTTGNKERPLRCSHIKETNPIADELVISVHSGQILGESGEPIQDMSVVNPSNHKYISITAPNGQQTKISSKLAIAMPYVSILGQGDNINQQTESSSAWIQLIQGWRNKIMQSAFIPSSSNFLDILEFSELIKE